MALSLGGVSGDPAGYGGPTRPSLSGPSTNQGGSDMTTTPQEPVENPDVSDDPDVDPDAPLDLPDKLSEIGDID